MSRAFRLSGENQLRAMQAAIDRRKVGAVPAGIHAPRPVFDVRALTIALTIALPWPPSANNLYPTGSDGKRHPSRDAMEFRQTASRIVQVEMMRHKFAPITGDVFVSLLLIPPDARRFDIDNRCKAVIDALEAGGMFANDAQVKHLEVRNLGPIRPGEAVANVTVRAIVEEATA
jgi:crossover junction endodeoxyribonuclease RusA